MSKRFQTIPVRAVATRDNNGAHHLSITDKLSGVEFCELHMTAEEFAKIITAHSTETVAEVRALGVVGKKKHRHTVQVETKYDGDDAYHLSLSKENHPGEPWKYTGYVKHNSGKTTLHYSWYEEVANEQAE